MGLAGGLATNGWLSPGIPFTEGPAPSGDATGATDTANLQAAINQAGTSGYTLALSQGTYTVTNLTAPAGGGSFGLWGQGPGRTFLGAPASTTGILLDLTYASAAADVQVGNMNINMTNATTMTGLRTQKINRLSVKNLTFRYGAIGWEHVQTQGNGPVTADWINGQNQTNEVFHLTGSTGLGCAGNVSNMYASVTDNSVVMTQGVLIDWYTVGWNFNNVQVLGNTASSFNIHSGIVNNTAAPTGLQGAFLYFTNCITDQTDTGNGLDLTNARGIWSANNFWGTAPSNNKDGVAINAGKEHFYVNDWISGRGMSFTNAPDKITIGSGCRFPQTSTGGALVMPGSSPPTNLLIDPSALFYSSITNNVTTLETACSHNWNWTRAGAYT